MDIDNYVPLALRTESVNFEDIEKRMADRDVMRLLHGAIGLATESGELTDALKKHVFYGADLDLVNLGEELGDLLWYAAVIADVLEKKTGMSMSCWLDRNISKLRVRYPAAFDDNRAHKRDLKAERRVLDGE